MKHPNLNTKYIALVAIMIATFFLIDNLRIFLNSINGYLELPDVLRYSLFYGLQASLCLVFGFGFLKIGNFDLSIWKALGLDSGFLKGIGWSFVFTLPMLFGYWLTSGINSGVTYEDIVFWSIVSPFVEELFYRALLLGFVFRFLRVGFIPSALLVSVIFGLGHLYQGNELIETLGIFGITFIGSFLFGWLFIEWKFNFGIIFGSHLLMNLYWNIFDIGASNALGGWGANIFRLLTLCLAIVITIKKIRVNGSQLSGRWLK